MAEATHVDTPSKEATAETQPKEEKNGGTKRKAQEDAPAPVSIPIKFVGKAGTEGKGDRLEFKLPMGLAFTSSDDRGERILVVDCMNHRICVLTPDLEPTAPFSFGKCGSGDGELIAPQYVACYKGEAFVTDWENKRVAVFSLEGKFKRNVPLGFGPSSLCVFKDHLWVVNHTESQLAVYTIHEDSEQVKLVRKVGTKGSDHGQLKNPIDITTDGQSIYVTDKDNNRVVVFNEDGECTKVFDGEDGHRFIGPRGVAVSEDGGLLYVSDKSGQVQVWNLRDGWTFEGAVGGKGTEDGLFSEQVFGLLVHGKRLFVTDHNQHRIQVFA